MQYNVLSASYTAECPVHGETSLHLSSFRRLHRLPGASHPALYGVEFSCPACQDQHQALALHDELDLAPVLGGQQVEFVDLLTDARKSMADELRQLALLHLRRGSWPWSFFCYPEGRTRPMVPSAIAAVAPGDGCFGVAVICPCCNCTSLNIVSAAHLDLPFFHDSQVGVIEHLFDDDLETIVLSFVDQLERGRTSADWHAL